MTNETSANNPLATNYLMTVDHGPLSKRGGGTNAPAYGGGSKFY